MGGGGTGGQMEVGIGLRLLRLLGSRYYYSSLAQEFSNVFWVDGRVAGRQGLITLPDPHRGRYGGGLGLERVDESPRAAHPGANQRD